MKFILKFILITLSIHNVFALDNDELFVSTIQRHKFVASSADGSKVAILLSHFGPSSQAPFVNLIVKEANKAKLIYMDGLMNMSGDENELLELEKMLIEKATQKIHELGMSLNNDLPTLAPAYWSEINSDETIGNIDLKNPEKGSPKFKISKIYNSNCSEPDKYVQSWQVEFAQNSLRSENFDKESICLTDDIKLRYIYRSGKTIWFVSQVSEQPLGNLQAYWIDFMGVKLT